MKVNQENQEGQCCAATMVVKICFRDIGKRVTPTAQRKTRKVPFLMHKNIMVAHAQIAASHNIVSHFFAFLSLKLLVACLKQLFLILTLI